MKESRRGFIKKSTGASAALLLPGISTVNSETVKEHPDYKPMVADNGQALKTGLAEMDITPAIGMERPGNYMKLYNKSLQDPCKVRVVVFDDGNKRAAIASVDAIGVPRSLVLSVREKVQARCGIPREAILIGATHSHSSGPIGTVQPGDYDQADPLIRSLAYEQSVCDNPEYVAKVEKNLVEAICQADSIKEESLLGVGTGHEDQAGANRRYLMKNGVTYTYPGRGNPDIIGSAGPIDPEVGVIGVWNKQGKCTGCIVNYARHANCSATGISANFIYFMEQTIRGAMGADCIVLFLPGATGDVSHANKTDPYASLVGLDRTRFVGGRIGAEAAKVLLSMPRGVMAPVDYRSKVLEMKRRLPDPQRVRNCYELVKKPAEKDKFTDWIFAKELVLLDFLAKKRPAVEAEVQTIQVGPAVFVSNPAELFCKYGLEIKAQSPFKFTFPVELANGIIGYVPTEDAFGSHGGGYETRLTSYSNLKTDAGNKIVEAGMELAWQMKPGTVPEFPPAKPFTGQPWTYGSVKPELK